MYSNYSYDFFFPRPKTPFFPSVSLPPPFTFHPFFFFALLLHGLLMGTDAGAFVINGLLSERVSDWAERMGWDQGGEGGCEF